jgi:very-short-patch-repair endonuclease
MADGTIAAVMARAARQDGAIDVEQLTACGIGRGAIEHLVETRWLRRVHRGVFLVGPVAGQLAYEHAALLGCGASAVVSHRSAAAVWRIGPPRTGAVDVTVTAGHRRPQRGIAVHHAALDAAHIRQVRWLRITCPARTLLDLAAILPTDELERAANEAQVLGLATATEIHTQLGAASGRRGAATLRAVLTAGPRLTRSELERRMHALADRVGLPRPRNQARVLGYTVDFLWPRERVIVETDGFGAHGTRMRFESDRSRDAALLAAGYRVLRFTWRQLVETPEVVAARLAVVLAHSTAAA